MIYAHRILSELDRHLDSPVELTLYGRAAFFLGFPDPPPQFSQSLDVDAILWLGQADELEANTNFWEALEETNLALKSEGYYMSHLFEENQVILTEGWREERASISGAWKHLCLTGLPDKDLFLSNLMRDDPQDREDALFIVRRNDWKVGTITEFFEEAVIPDLQEIHDEFDKARVALLREL
ncbi:MAG: hypothetical protein QNL33_19195 [Akkermansiaceae bacterium]|jgi:hypothetical protein